MKIEWLNSIRSVITFFIIWTWCWGFVGGSVSSEAFAGTVGAIITFYFVGKKREENK
jgi:hypothetical protein